MFTIIKTKELKEIKRQLYIQQENRDVWLRRFRKASADVSSLEKKLDEALEENKRLFDHHNERLTKPRKDKKGILRKPNGEFAKVKK